MRWSWGLRLGGCRALVLHVNFNAVLLPKSSPEVNVWKCIVNVSVSRQCGGLWILSVSHIIINLSDCFNFAACGDWITSGLTPSFYVNELAPPSGDPAEVKYQLRVDAGLIENTWIMQTICKVQYCEKVLGTLRRLYVFVNHMMLFEKWRWPKMYLQWEKGVLQHMHWSLQNLYGKWPVFI